MDRVVLNIEMDVEVFATFHPGYIGNREEPDCPPYYEVEDVQVAGVSVMHRLTSRQLDAINDQLSASLDNW